MEKRNKKFLRMALSLATGTAVVVLMLHMGGIFTANKVGPGSTVTPPKESFVKFKTAEAKIETITEFYEAVGTVRPRTETTVEAQISAKVEQVLVKPGQNVVRGEPLLILDSRELRSRLSRAEEGLVSASARREQAFQGLTAAKAVYSQAEAAYNRIRKYLEAQAATLQDLEIAEAAFLQARAKVRQAEDAIKEADAGVNKAEKLVEEAKIALGYTWIKAHEQGQIARRLVEPGDLAVPGKPLIVIQTRGSLRLEAMVREGHVQKVLPGAGVRVAIDALSLAFDASVEELVPSGDPSTRTFVVKTGLPQDERIFPGMFGRLLVPLEEIRVITVPRKAVNRVGQLDTVLVKIGEGWNKVMVKTGRTMGERIEILSGLSGGEIIALTGGEDNA